MLVIILLIVITLAWFLIFGKADEKRAILKEVGLDLDEKKYKETKEKEFRNYCKKAMIVAVDSYNAQGDNEAEFLSSLSTILFSASNQSRGYITYDNDDDYLGKSPNYNLQVRANYIDFAEEVVRRRKKELGLGETASKLPYNYIFTDRHSLKNYIDWLWEEYQYPWPYDWLQKN